MTALGNQRQSRATGTRHRALRLPLDTCERDCNVELQNENWGQCWKQGHASWGQRWPSEMSRGYNGYVLRREGKAILFAGDTAHTPLFAELRSRGPFEAAIMPIGAYQPWIWNHCSPEQALAMANAARARYLVPVHHQTFRLSEEPMGEPIERLAAALEHEPERLALRKIGESFLCPKT